jgi:hypothetical protein
MSTSLVSLLLLYSKTLGNICPKSRFHSSLSRFPTIYYGMLPSKQTTKEFKPHVHMLNFAIIVATVNSAMSTLCYFIMSHATLILFYHYTTPSYHVHIGCRESDITKFKVYQSEEFVELWACNPISFKNMSFENTLLKPHQTTYHSNIDVQIR